MYKKFFRRMIDIALSFIGIIVLAVPMIIVSIDEFPIDVKSKFDGEYVEKISFHLKTRRSSYENRI